MQQERISYWDNLKVFLIFLVVFAHFLRPFKSDYVLIKQICYYIYIFHMPAFIFVSGFFAKKYMKKDVPNISKLTGLLILYIIFEILLAVTKVLLKDVDFELSLFYTDDASWYLLVLLVWFIILPVFAKMKMRYGLIVSFICGVIVGFNEYFGDFFTASRVVVFLPFFLLGYYMKEDIPLKITSLKCRIGSVIILGVSLIVFFFKWDFFRKYELTIYGNKNYYLLSKFDISQWNMMYARLVWYIAAFVLVFAIMSLIPKRKLIISFIGSRTMAIYIMHIIIRNIAVYYIDLYVTIKSMNTVIVFCFLASIGVILILSWKRASDLFNLAFKIHGK